MNYYRACCRFGSNSGALSRGFELLTFGLTAVEATVATRLLSALALVGVGAFHISKVVGTTLIREGVRTPNLRGGGCPETYCIRLPKQLENCH